MEKLEIRIYAVRVRNDNRLGCAVDTGDERPFGLFNYDWEAMVSFIEEQLQEAPLNSSGRIIAVVKMTKGHQINPATLEPSSDFSPLTLSEYEELERRVVLIEQGIQAGACFAC